MPEGRPYGRHVRRRANDAPALRQAEIGIAVATATDVAKSAAGLVLTEPGLGGIVAAVTEGRATFQRILTYTLNALLKKIEMALFSSRPLDVRPCGAAPILMVLLLVTNDFLTMSLTTDPAGHPEAQCRRIGPITTAAIALGLVKLAFSTAVLAIGRFGLGLTIGPLRTLAFFTMVVDAQATVYAIRERRRPWSSARADGLSLDAADLGVGALVALSGWLTPSLWVGVVIGLIAAAAAFALLLDVVKRQVFHRLGIA